MKKKLSLCLVLLMQVPMFGEIQTSRWYKQSRSSNALPSEGRQTNVATEYLCTLDSQSDEVLIHVYDPSACSCKRVKCNTDLANLKPQQMSVLNWGAGTKIDRKYKEAQEGFLGKLSTIGHPNHKYDGILLVDELSNAMPMWWRLASTTELENVVTYLRKTVAQYPDFSQPEKSVLMLSLDNPSDGDLSEESKAFLAEHFDVVNQQQDDYIKGLLLKLNRRMLSDIQNFENQGPKYIQEALMEKATRIIGEKITALEPRDFAILLIALATLYTVKSIYDKKPANP